MNRRRFVQIGICAAAAAGLSGTVIYSRKLRKAPMILRPVRAASVYDLVIYHHGAGENEQAVLADSLKAGVVAALRQRGYLIAGISAHGNNWGNQAALDDYVALYDYCSSNFSLNKTVFLSQSMGGLSGLLSLAAGNIPNVVGWYGIYPVCDLRDLYDLGTYAGDIRTAYGIAVDGSDYNAKTSGHDPMLISASGFPAIRYRFTASSSDTVVPKSSNSDDFAAKMNGRAVENTVIACTGNHGHPSHFDANDVLSFFYRCIY